MLAIMKIAKLREQLEKDRKKRKWKIMKGEENRWNEQRTFKN